MSNPERHAETMMSKEICLQEEMKSYSIGLLDAHLHEAVAGVCHALQTNTLRT